MPRSPVGTVEASCCSEGPEIEVSFEGTCWRSSSLGEDELPLRRQDNDLLYGGGLSAFQLAASCHVSGEESGDARVTDTRLCCCFNSFSSQMVKQQLGVSSDRSNANVFRKLTTSNHPNTQRNPQEAS